MGRLNLLRDKHVLSNPLLDGVLGGMQNKGLRLQHAQHLRFMVPFVPKTECDALFGCF